MLLPHEKLFCPDINLNANSEVENMMRMMEKLVA